MVFLYSYLIILYICDSGNGALHAKHIPNTSTMLPEDVFSLISEEHRLITNSWILPSDFSDL